MINKPRCSKASPKIKDMALYCSGDCLCAHQYYCPATRRYENTPGFGQCKRLEPKKAEQGSPIATPQYNAPVVARAEQDAQEKTETASVNVERYTMAVSETAAEQTDNKETGRRQADEGRVRKSGRRSRKKC